MRRRVLSLIVAFSLGSVACNAPESATPPTPRRVLLAVSKTDHVLAIVDPATLRVLARVPVGEDPHEVIASSDGTTAYVSNNGSGRLHAISVIDLTTRKARPSIDTGALIGTHGLAFVDHRVWFTAEGSNAVARFDPSTARIDTVVGLGQNRTHMLRVRADGKELYTTNVDSGTVSIVDAVRQPPPIPPTGVVPPTAKPRDVWVQTVIPAGHGAEGIDVSPDGRELWTANAHDGSFTVIDLATKRVSATIDAKLPGAARVQFTPDGALALITSLRTGDLVAYDARSRQEWERVHLGRGAAHILVDDDGSRVFVSCTPDNYVAVIDLRTLTVTGHLDVGGRPDGLVWATRR